MRACPACGASNDPQDDFCGNCGAYLGWSESAAAAPGRAAEPPADLAADSDPAPVTGPAPRGAAAAGSVPTPAAVPAPDAAPATSPPPEAAESARRTGESAAAPGASARPPARRGSAPARPDSAGDTAPGTDAETQPESERAAGPEREAETGPERAAGPEPEAPASARRETGRARRRTPPALGRPGRGERPAPGPARSSAPPPGQPPAPVAPVTPAAPGDARSDPAPRPPSAPAADASAPGPVLPVRPGRPVAPRPTVRPVAVPDDVAGTPCPACGTPNPPGRRFCRRCAAVLNPEEKPPPLPWWRTVWPFRRRARASSGRVARLLVILAVVAALCAGGFLLLPAGRALIEDTRDKLGKPKPITPVSVEASDEVPGHPARNTTDGLSNRYWGASAEGASVTYTFRRPFRLVDLLITNGASASAQPYARQARALELELEVTTQDGTRHTKKLTLGDKPGPQPVRTGISDVKTVRLVLRSPTGLAPGRHLALAEVEFFQRS